MTEGADAPSTGRLHAAAARACYLRWATVVGMSASCLRVNLAMDLNTHLGRHLQSLQTRSALSAGPITPCAVLSGRKAEGLRGSQAVSAFPLSLRDGRKH